MKLSLATFAILLTAASAARVTQQEADEAFECVRRSLTSVDQGNDGSQASCQFLYCFQDFDSKHNRGGLFGKLSYIIDPLCGAEGLVERVFSLGH
ncbi:hypothetical protein BGW36DRAFT_378670 [Talaromyces proteolyticus]|uniref:Uncharacterized protein n=1 Tax=Talaromyces proteolyticus TaxID=1131652 RepID=A0AAD4KW64_9EURO|nr:uncharacterized protein BGW36DRAFT_378670 [Talaromyces proteolyticus]KAH8697419.1 hypothetical protein BGW36DRAFT_378670 [Talaromyces proteolyticus]